MYGRDRLRRPASGRGRAVAAPGPGRVALAAGLAGVLAASLASLGATTVDAAPGRTARTAAGHPAGAAAVPPTGRPADHATGRVTERATGPSTRRRGKTAAERHGWGEPLSRWSDEFDYGSEAGPAVPDQAKWRLAGGGPGKCWPGHAGNGRRCDANTRVVGGILRMTGEAGGDTGWLASPHGRRYGRWEARVRSRATAPDNGRPYHPLLILWPDSEEHPRDGEYDYLENGAPGERCAEAFLHYPHSEDVPVQQEFARKCGVDLSQWRNVAVEWTPEVLRGFIDGEEWFRFSGGANADRDCIQCAPSMHQTVQLDNFHGEDLQSAVYEVDWARVYDLRDGASRGGASRGGRAR